MKIEQGDKIIYTDNSNSVLNNGQEYTIFSVSETGIQVYIKTGFVGLTNDRFKLKK